MLLPLVSGLAAASALLCITGSYRHNNKLVYCFKPLTTMLIMAVAWIASAEGSGSSYNNWIFAALLFCLIGDVFLMLDDKFLQGLGSFFVAHLLFALAFWGLNQAFTSWLLALLCAIGTALYLYLLPHLGSMRLPVLAYFMVIICMTWRAWENQLLFASDASLLVAVGTVIFMFSDLCIALDKFRRPFKSAEALILGGYFLAIWLISISLSH